MLTTADRMEAYSSVQGLCLYLSSKEKATNNSYDGSCQAFVPDALVSGREYLPRCSQPICIALRAALFPRHMVATLPGMD